MTGWIAEGFLARVRGLVGFVVIAVWLGVTGTVIRFISHGLKLGDRGQNILWAIAIGATLWGIFRIFKASAARSRAEIAALSTLSSTQMDVLLSTRPDMRWAIVRETAGRMFRERLATKSRAELEEMLKGSPELADEARGELKRRREQSAVIGS